jgi:N-acetyltransferase
LISPLLNFKETTVLFVVKPKPKMTINIQPILETEKVMLYPLEEQDFEHLYHAASDPKVWEQHPNKDRWKREVFKTFFVGAMESKGAFKIIDKATGSIIGSTRFYDYTANENSILIGYTFYATAFWGTGTNHAVKTVMLDYIFNQVATVYFHIGANNLRSQIAIGRLGATLVKVEDIAYYGEQPKLNHVYQVGKHEWVQSKHDV